MGEEKYCIKVLLAMYLDTVIPGALMIACNTSSFHPGLLRACVCVCRYLCVCLRVHACLCASVQVSLCAHAGVYVDQRTTFL